jgi:hypothetical protein
MMSREWLLPDSNNMFSAYLMFREWSIPDSKTMFSAYLMAENILLLSGIDHSLDIK